MKALQLKSSIVVLVGVCLVLSACKEKPTDPTTHEIVGDWAWVESVGGIAGVTQRPDSQHWRSLAFREDGKYLEWRNDEIVTNSTYIVVKGESMFNEGLVDLVNIPANGEPSQSFVLRRSHNDTLILEDNVIDGFRSTYVRMIREPGVR